jgi:hypothetical protein
MNVARVCVASRLTTPVGLTHGAAHVTVILAVPVGGATGSFSVAVMTLVLVSTSVAPSAGVSAVTAGTSAATPFVPRMGSLPQPAANTPSAPTINHIRDRGWLSMIFMCIPNPDLRETTGRV